jgi:hypothetical protein
VLTLRDGEWVTALDGTGEPGSETPCEVFRLDLDVTRRVVRVIATAKLCLLTALCEGRVVGVAGPVRGPDAVEVRAARIDAVTVTTLAPTGLLICADIPVADQTADWRDVPPLVRGLQMPFRELLPALSTEADELAEARSRLLPGETIDAESFARLSRALRPVLGVAGPPRPSELVLLLREAETDDADQARGLDPVRVLLAHPTWRRALGFAYLDDDPALVAGQAYEYRVSATFPAPDVVDANHGFATIPAGTLLPADFSVGSVRIRVPGPVPVTLDPATPGAGLVRVSRRGIPLDPARDPLWAGPSLDDWSLVVDFPQPVAEVVLELAPGHDLAFASGPSAGLFGTTDAVPAGSMPRLVLATPAQQVRLRGTGFLHALRAATVPDGEKVEVDAVTPPVLLVDTPLPAAPISAAATNLQVAAAAPVDATPPDQTPVRHALGFTVTWRPAPAFGLTAWPTDADAAVPLDATIFQVERRREPAGPWEPVLAEENWTLGDRDGTIRDLALPPGSQLLAAFPDDASRPGGAALDLSFVDTFTGGSGLPEPPEVGSRHRYRVRAIDPIGRPSPDWRETDSVRLEKHVPPPVPVGPAEAGQAAPDEPIGVQVRVLVRGATDLTAAEEALLGTAQTATVLRWGWHPTQRDQDPLASEFRVYAAPPLDVVAGVLTAVTTLSSGFATSYRVDLQLDRPVAADAAAGLRLDAGHPFLIRSHTAGSIVQMVVETRLLAPDGTPPVPAPGPVRLALPLTPDRTRPTAWTERVAVRPITTDTSYQVVLPDRLVVDQDHLSDAMWLGVSAADDQEYVADQRAPAESRPGNESAVVPVLATARFAGRPSLEVPPPLAAVPEVRTPEPGAEPLRFVLDLSGHLPAEALATAVRHERVSARVLVAACATTADGRVVGRPVEPLTAGDADQHIPITNPDDRAELVAALRSGASSAVEDRFLVYLAGHHPYRDRLFAAAHVDPRPPGPFPEELPPAPERWLYRARAVDRAGHLSAGSATVRAVVRVPSLLAGPAPMRLPREAADPPNLLRVSVPDDTSVTHLLVFHAPSEGVGPVVSGVVTRVPNRPDLLPTGFWLAGPDGMLLTPTATDLTDPSVAIESDGSRRVRLTVPVATGARTRVWLASLTRDGIPSPLAGPWTVLGADTHASARG